MLHIDAICGNFFFLIFLRVRLSIPRDILSSAWISSFSRVHILYSSLSSSLHVDECKRSNSLINFEMFSLFLRVSTWDARAHTHTFMNYSKVSEWLSWVLWTRWCHGIDSVFCLRTRNAIMSRSTNGIPFGNGVNKLLRILIDQQQRQYHQHDDHDVVAVTANDGDSRISRNQFCRSRNQNEKSFE